MNRRLQIVSTQPVQGACRSREIWTRLAMASFSRAKVVHALTGIRSRGRPLRRHRWREGKSSLNLPTQLVMSRGAGRACTYYTLGWGRPSLLLVALRQFLDEIDGSPHRASSLTALPLASYRPQGRLRRGRSRSLFHQLRPAPLPAPLFAAGGWGPAILRRRKAVEGRGAEAPGRANGDKRS